MSRLRHAVKVLSGSPPPDLNYASNISFTSHLQSLDTPHDRNISYLTKVSLIPSHKHPPALTTRQPPHHLEATLILAFLKALFFAAMALLTYFLTACLLLLGLFLSAAEATDACAQLVSALDPTKSTTRSTRPTKSHWRHTMQLRSSFLSLTVSSRLPMRTMLLQLSRSSLSCISNMAPSSLS